MDKGREETTVVDYGNADFASFVERLRVVADVRAERRKVGPAIRADFSDHLTRIGLALAVGFVGFFAAIVLLAHLAP